MSVTVTSSTITVDVTTTPITVRTGALSALWGNISGTLSNQGDLQSALNLKATIASPAFTGTPTAPTPISGDNSTQIATTAWVQNQGYIDLAYADTLYQPLSSTLTTLSGLTVPNSGLVGLTDAQTVSNKTLTTVEKIEFDTATPSASSVVGGMNWNNTDGTVDLKLKGGLVTLQIGQEILHRCLNNSGVALTDKDVVYITGAQGQRLTVAKAQANSLSTSSVLGMVTEPIANGAEGFVTVEGLVRQISTSGLADGTAVYLSASTAGAITSTMPSEPNVPVLVGTVVNGNSGGAGSIFVKPQFLSRNATFTSSITAATGTLVNREVKLANATSNNIVLTLPTAANGHYCYVKKTDNTLNYVRIQGAGGATIDGSASIDLTSQYEAVQLISDGTNWFIF